MFVHVRVSAWMFNIIARRLGVQIKIIGRVSIYIYIAAYMYTFNIGLIVDPANSRRGSALRNHCYLIAISNDRQDQLIIYIVCSY